MLENLIWLTGGVLIGATWYKAIRPLVRSWSGGRLFADGVGSPAATEVGGLKAVQASQNKV